MAEQEKETALEALGSYEKSYVKGETVFSAGTLTRFAGLVLSGSVSIENIDIWGNCTILGMAAAGDLFAESYAMLPEEPMMVDVTANENTRILFIGVGKLSDLTGPMEVWQSRLLRNLMILSARRNVSLSERSFHTSPKSVRGRIMAYLSTVSLRLGSREFDIPFSRQQMADYLNLDRSALSKELGRMRDEGLLTCHKSHFKLLDWHGSPQLG